MVNQEAKYNPFESWHGTAVVFSAVKLAKIDALNVLAPCALDSGLRQLK